MLHHLDNNPPDKSEHGNTHQEAKSEPEFEEHREISHINPL
jgi:hypothetical protein